MDRPAPRLRATAACAAIFAAAFAAYVPAIRGGFIWDDDAHVTKAALRSVEGLGRIWFEIGATQQYYPVLHSAFWIEHRLWGDSALAYHLLNVALHGTAACLLAFALMRLWPKREGRCPGAAAWLAAALFALHPVCVESVAWVSEQKNTLSAVLYLGSALAYLGWTADRETGAARPRRYWIATGLFALALLTKSVTATLPAALLVIAWWQRGSLSWRRDARPLAPWFGMGAAAGLFTAWVERVVLGAEGEGFSLGLLERCLLAGRVAWFYLGKLLWPADLVFIYPRWTVDASQAWQYLFSAAAVVLLAGLWAAARRGRRGPLAAALVFGGTLFPALGFFNVYPFLFSYVADHFQYLASAAVIGLAAAGWEAWRSRSAKAGRTLAPDATALALVAVLGFLANQQCRIYKDAETLYRSTLAGNPACWMAEYNLGVTFHNSGRADEALASYRAALRLRPDFPQARNNLGVVLAGRGRNAEALPQFEAAIAAYRKNPRLAPENAEAEGNLARALQALGRNAEAATHFEAALRLKPDMPAVSSSLSRMLVEFGRAGEAIRSTERALLLSPEDPELHNNLAVALCAAGRTAEAIPHYKQALRFKPDYPDAVLNLAMALRQEGRIPEAVASYQEALRLKPDFAEASAGLGVILAQSGRPTEAAACFERAIRSGLATADVHYDLGIALRESGRTAEAIAQYVQALRIRPDYPEAENDLGIALAQSDRLEEAVAHFRAAARLKLDYADPHSNLSVILRQLGRTREAQAEAAEAARLGAPPAR